VVASQGTDGQLNTAVRQSVSQPASAVSQSKCSQASAEPLSVAGQSRSSLPGSKRGV